MDEFSFIRSIAPKVHRQSGLIKGIGDDTAVFRQPYQDIVTAVDTFVEGVHFTSETMDPYHVGYRVLAANISDIAAMGGTPAFYMIAIVIPEGWTEEGLASIYKGMDDLASLYHIDLIGGDTVSGNELSISVTIIGYVEQNKVRYRSHAREKDIVFATGTLGDSSAGLYLLTNEDSRLSEEARNYLINRHRMPSPRVAFAKALHAAERVALNDISDGIANEAAEIAEASNISIHLYDEQIPVHQSLKRFNREQQRKWKLFGGEDFELIGTVPEQDWPIVAAASGKAKIPVTKIGFVTNPASEAGSVVLHEGNRQTILDKAGYTHLK
ncbi:thiamine-phosphate kinase [Sediminibacillus dalangtanensis]|uniref:Thiamine-monophosphate kinase n=1 Tax=Sediminibacillus dalangtanensis TaxID=2729421 RepID=A0ABX7VNX1_9BACI|nr:thiamine-phosphate kinase [Sediminibacillus dalangtanensis]QTM98138.1 thiamine-phosphate kinase [Sediminibacillus dalangtanensis]